MTKTLIDDDYYDIFEKLNKKYVDFLKFVRAKPFTKESHFHVRILKFAYSSDIRYWVHHVDLPNKELYRRILNSTVSNHEYQLETGVSKDGKNVNHVKRTGSFKLWG